MNIHAIPGNMSHFHEATDYRSGVFSILAFTVIHFLSMVKYKQAQTLSSVYLCWIESSLKMFDVKFIIIVKTIIAGYL